MPNTFTARTSHPAPGRRAFTLIEIIIVIALTTLLFALLLVPLVSAIKYTRQVQSLTAAQDAVRITRERLTRELSSAVYVFDNTSHPFVFSAPVQAGDDLATNFLVLDVPTNTKGTTAAAHVYNAKLAFSLPRVNDTGVNDPTTNEPISYGKIGSGSAVIVSPSQVFPAAAGGTMVWYFVGLKDPTQSYNNNREANSDGTKPDNTYILYRAQFQPYKKDPTTGKYLPNTDLFALTANGKAPELDDPDFFRYVNVKNPDVNWLDAAHAAYPTQGAGTPGSPEQHNARVDNWRTIAKPVIPGPNVDLILLPRNADNTINYDTSGAFNGVAHSGAARDPVTGSSYPIVNTSIAFRPGTVSGDATPATTTEYTSAGVPLVAGDTGMTFIPSVYTAAAQSWSLPYKVTLTPPSAPSGQVSGGDTYTTGQDSATGHTYEYNSMGTAVYDLTLSQPIGTATSYVPLSINADSGTISFDTPSFPDPSHPSGREWLYTPVATPVVNSVTTYTVDLKTLGGNIGPSPLGTIVDATAKDSGGNPILTARIVPGSVRVYGPDETAGPGHYQPGVLLAQNQSLVLYTEASQGAVGGDNQYRVDYGNSIIYLLGNGDQFGAASNPAPVKIIYNYQANMAPVGMGTVAAMTNLTQTPMNVSVDYRTRDLIDVSLGVRIYDISTGRAQVIPSEFKAKIGNSNR